MPGAIRTLSPLPLFDESSLLSACANCEGGAIAPIHATNLWKTLLRRELDTYHPGYIERLNSRLSSRASSKQSSRQHSRRPSIGSSSEAKTIQTVTVPEGDEEAVEADSAHTVSSPSSASTSVITPTLSESALQYEAEAIARGKLEAEDDALIATMATFPRPNFNPSDEELKDPNSTIHNLTIDASIVPGLPGRMYPMLASSFSYLTSRLQSHKTSADGSTTKLLIRLQDQQHIESVIMRHKIKDPVTGRVEQRITLCVSSQVGCAMGCTFCATGTMGMRGNLLMGEILEQLIHANRFEKIRNIVFMGMGEPLKNYSQVLAAIQAMTDGSRFGLAPSRITLSTVGVIPRMLELTRDIPTIQLALSLHAPNQELRQQIVPTARSYPLEKLIEACDYFIQRSKKRILIEYVMLDGVNASEKEAHELGQLLKGKEVLINLIPYNSTAVAANYHAPPREQSVAFQQILQNQYGLFTTIRVEMGADIDGACGQLALENQDSLVASSNVKPRGLQDDTATVEELATSSGCASGASTDIEDLGKNNGGQKKPVVKRRVASPAAASETASPDSSCSPSATKKSCSESGGECDCEEQSKPSADGTTAENADATSSVFEKAAATSAEASQSTVTVEKSSSVGQAFILVAFLLLLAALFWQKTGASLK